MPSFREKETETLKQGRLSQGHSAAGPEILASQLSHTWGGEDEEKPQSKQENKTFFVSKNSLYPESDWRPDSASGECWDRLGKPDRVGKESWEQCPSVSAAMVGGACVMGRGFDSESHPTSAFSDTVVLTSGYTLASPGEPQYPGVATTSWHLF